MRRLLAMTGTDFSRARAAPAAQSISFFPVTALREAWSGGRLGSADPVSIYVEFRTVEELPTERITAPVNAVVISKAESG